MSLVLQSSGGGQITIQEPATASNFTQSLPAATGTVMVSGNMPAFSAYGTANQSVTSGVITKVVLNAEDFDTANCFDSTTNYRFTPNVAGYYQFNLPATSFSNTTQMTGVVSSLYKNGSQYALNQSALGTNSVIQSVSLSIIAYANGTTDYFEMYVQLNASGGSPVISGSSSRPTSFSGCLVRAA